MIRLIFLPLLACFLSSISFAQDMPFDGMGSFPNDKIKLDYSGFTEPVDPGSYSRLGMGAPIYHREDLSWGLTLKGSQLRVDDGIVIPDETPLQVPESLSTAEIGIQYTQKLVDDRSAGGKITYGSASDKLFSSSGTRTLGVNLFYSTPAENPNDRWIWAVFYSNNSPIFSNIPIPGFAYFFKRDDLMGVTGLPFIFLRWNPNKGPWSFTFFDLLTIMKAEVGYGPVYFQYFGGFDWNQQTWLRGDSDDKKEKLYFDEKKIYIGLRLALNKNLFTEWQLGQAFDRSFYEGESVLKKGTGVARLDASWYLSLSLKANF